MRFDRLDLLCYGGFQDTHLEFPANASDLHVIYGPNEAGKSTTLRAIRDFLFGFPHLVGGDAWRAQAALLRVGAVLEHEGTRFEAIRRRGRGKTLYAPDDKTALDELPLHSWLAGQDASQFEAAWALDHMRLRKGGQDMQKLENDAGLQLLAAGLGLENVGSLTARLAGEVDTEWKPTRARSLIREASNTLRDLRQSLRAKTTTAKALASLRAAVEDAETAIATNQKERETLAERRRTLDRRKSISIPYRQLVETENALLDAPGPDLSGADCDHAASLLQTLGNETHTLSTSHPKRDALDAQIAMLGKTPPILKDTTVIQDLLKRHSQHEQTRETIRKRDHSLTMDGIWLAQFRDRQYMDPTRLPSTAALAELAERLDARRDLQTKIEDAQTRAQDATRQLRALEMEVSADVPSDGANPAGRLRDFRSALDEILALGPLDHTISDLDERVRERHDATLIAYGALRPWVPTGENRAEELSAVSIPEPDALRHEATLWRDWDRKRQDALADVLDQQAKIECLTDELAQIRADGQAVSREALEAARLERDQRWVEINQLLLATEIPPRPLRQAFETLLKNADGLADRRHTHAEQSARLADLSRQHDKLTRDRDDAGRRAEAATTELSRREAGWAALLDRFGAPVLPPADLERWAVRRDTALQSDRELRNLELQHARALSERTNAIKRLQSFVPECGSDRLAIALSAAAARYDQEAQENERTKARHDELNRLRVTHTTEAAKLDTLKRQEATWEQSWTEACSTCGYTGRAEPAALEDVKEARTVQTRYESERACQDSDQSTVAELDQGLTTILERYGLSSLGDLEHCLEAAQTAERSRLSFLEQRERLQTEIEDSNATIAKLRAELSPILARLRLDNPDALPHALARARDRAGLNDQSTTFRNLILEAGGGRTIEALLNEARQTDPETLERDLADLEAEEITLGLRRDEAQKRLFEARAELNAIEASGGAHEIAAQIQETEADIAEHAARYVSLKLQQLMLERLSEQGRDRAHGPLLTRAGALFSRLTLGAYDGLVVDDGSSGDPVLAGQRPGNTALVHVASMSEGTRDQLYLALRIASVEQALDRGISLPFLADDLFITFDEERTAAGLSILADLSRKTQVFLFTHHRYILNCAEEFGHCLEIVSRK